MILREPQAPFHSWRNRADTKWLKKQMNRICQNIIFQCLNLFAVRFAQSTSKIVRHEVVISELSRPPAMAGED